MPLKLTMRPLCEGLKSPTSVTVVPTGPELGTREEMLELAAKHAAERAKVAVKRSAENRRMLRTVPPESNNVTNFLIRNQLGLGLSVDPGCPVVAPIRICLPLWGNGEEGKSAK